MKSKHVFLLVLLMLTGCVSQPILKDSQSAVVDEQREGSDEKKDWAIEVEHLPVSKLEQERDTGAAVAINPKDTYQAQLFEVKQELQRLTSSYAPPALNDAPACSIDFVAQNINYDSIGRLILGVRKLLDQQCSEIVLNIMTDGGSIEQAVAAYNFLKGLDVHIITNNLATIQSAGMVIYCAGDERYAEPNSFFMHHDTSWSTSGDTKANFVDYMQVSESIWLASLNGCIPDNVLRDSVDGGRRSYYWSSEQAARMGIVTNTDKLHYHTEYWQTVYGGSSN